MSRNISPTAYRGWVPPHCLLDPVNPPVARISIGIGPWLFGARAIDSDDSTYVGNQVLRDNGHYHRTLTLARLGVLPWYLLLVYLSWNMARRWLGEWPAALATILLIFCPPILANASLATTDLPFAAIFLLAIDRIWIALCDSRWNNYAWAGIAVGLDCATKMSGLPFTFLCALVLVIWLWFVKRRAPRLRAVVFALVVMALTIWAVYRFQVGPPPLTAPRTRAHVARTIAGTGPLRPVVNTAIDHLPAYQYFLGIYRVRMITKNWPYNYLFGETYSQGRAYFFFVMLLVKTPIPLLILGFAGLWHAMRLLFSRSDLFAIVPVTGFFVPMLLATTSREHIGLRHVLVVYPFLAMLGALAARQLLAIPAETPGGSKAQLKWMKAGAVILLVAWSVLATAIATPDYIPWYNLASAPWAAYIHVDNDFDWGQDLWRLSKKLRSLKVNRVWLSYFGTADLDQFHLPSWQSLPPGVPEKGWIAISETNFRTKPDAFGWLAAYKPVAIAGKTIRIYHIQ